MTHRMGHPRLLFTEEELMTLRRKVLDEPFRSILANLFAEADHIVDEGPPPGKIIADPDIRGDYEIKAVACAGKLKPLGFCYIFTKHERYAHKALEILKATLGWDRWSDPCHQGLDVDLLTGELCAFVGFAYDCLYDVLSETTRHQIVEVLAEKLRSVIRCSWDPEIFWTYRCTSQWSATVHGGAGVAALAIVEEYPEAEAWVDRFESKVQKFLTIGGGPDGGRYDGLSNWSRGLTMALLFADSLKRVSEGRRNLFQNECIRKTALFPLYLSTSDLSHCYTFSDTLSSGFDPLPLAKIASELRDPYAQWLYKRLAELRAGELYTLLWYDSTVPEKAPTDLPYGRLFRGVNIGVLRSGWDPKGDVLFILKGGRNEEPLCHFDLNSFFLAVEGEPLAIDLGKGHPPEGISHYAYFQRYYHGDRANDPYISTASHNTILVDGGGQGNGKRYSGEIIRFLSSAWCDYMVGDASRGYEPHLKRFLRHVIFVRPNYILLWDELETEGRRVKFQWGLQTWVDVHVEKSTITLLGERGAATFRILRPTECSIDIAHPLQSSVTLESPKRTTREEFLLLIVPHTVETGPILPGVTFSDGEAMTIVVRQEETIDTFLFVREGGKGIDVEGIRTDGEIAFVRRHGSQATAFAIFEGQHLDVDGVTYLDSDVPVEVIWSIDKTVLLGTVTLNRFGAIGLRTPEKLRVWVEGADWERQYDDLCGMTEIDLSPGTWNIRAEARN